MKKLAILVLSLILFVMPFSVCSVATDIADGTYEVPVALMHKEDEKESFGNRYIASTALLKVENGKKTITILLTTDMNGIEFSYYINGSLEGDVSEGTPVSDVTVKGETYKQGFEIPVMAEGDIGLKFSIPVMPMSPSARLRIDYDNAVSVHSDKETTTEQTTTVPASTETTTQPIITTTTETTVPTTLVTATAASTVPSTVATTVPTTTAPTTVPAAQSTAAQDAQAEQSTSFGQIVILIVAVIASSAIATYLFDRKKGDKK